VWMLSHIYINFIMTMCLQVWMLIVCQMMMLTSSSTYLCSLIHCKECWLMQYRLTSHLSLLCILNNCDVLKTVCSSCNINPSRWYRCLEDPSRWYYCFLLFTFPRKTSCIWFVLLCRYHVILRTVIVISFSHVVTCSWENASNRQRH